MKTIETLDDGRHAWLDYDFVEQHIYPSDAIEAMIVLDQMLEDDGKLLVDLDQLELHDPHGSCIHWLDVDTAVERLGVEAADLLKVAESQEALCRVGENGDVEYLLCYEPEGVTV